MRLVKLTKIKESENPEIPNHIPENFEVIGDMINLPSVGSCFHLSWFFRTSTVQEIIDDYTFRTYNSIYQFTDLGSSIEDIISGYIVDTENKLALFSVVLYQNDPIPFRIKEITGDKARITKKEFCTDPLNIIVNLNELTLLKYEPGQ